VPGEWLDDQGFVYPAFRERAAEIRRRKGVDRAPEHVLFEASTARR
jgi:hypothetical protein